MTHVLTEYVSPAHYIIRCSCGWSAMQPRRQNALARAAKLRAAVAHHLTGGSSPLLPKR